MATLFLFFANGNLFGVETLLCRQKVLLTSDEIWVSLSKTIHWQRNLFFLAKSDFLAWEDEFIPFRRLNSISSPKKFHWVKSDFLIERYHLTRNLDFCQLGFAQHKNLTNLWKVTNIKRTRASRKEKLLTSGYSRPKHWQETNENRQSPNSKTLQITLIATATKKPPTLEKLRHCYRNSRNLPLRCKETLSLQVDPMSPSCTAETLSSCCRTMNMPPKNPPLTPYSTKTASLLPKHHSRRPQTPTKHLKKWCSDNPKTTAKLQYLKIKNKQNPNPNLRQLQTPPQAHHLCRCLKDVPLEINTQTKLRPTARHQTKARPQPHSISSHQRRTGNARSRLPSKTPKMKGRPA